MATTPEHPASGYPAGNVGDDSSAHQLDFYQAMSDFKHMFPNMDEEIIEAVLRANNGAVDATIDQLLTMNIDSEGSQDTAHVMSMPMPKPVPLLPPSSKSPVMAPLHSSDDEDGLPPYPPPSYTDYTHSMQPPVPERSAPAPTSNKPPIPSSVNLLDTPISALMAMGSTNLSISTSTDADLLGAVGGLSSNSAAPGSNSAGAMKRSPGGHFTEATPHQPVPSLLDSDYGPGAPPPPPRQQTTQLSVDTAPPLPPKFYKAESPVSRSSTVGSGQDVTPTKKRGPKRLLMNWNPPLLGNLPDDFLRLSLPSQGLSAPLGLSAQRLEAACGSPSPRSPRSAGSSPHMGSGRPSQRSPNRTPGSGELSSALIQQKMAENERRRSSLAGGDQETAQMLEDERLALMLQNEEFLIELMHDEDFMRTLQRDRMNATAFEPPPEPDPTLDPKRPRPGFISDTPSDEPSSTQNESADDELVTDGLETTASDEILGGNFAKYATPRDQLEGYGDDRDKYLGAFPFDRPMCSSESADFRKQLSHMGGSSKKKFAAAAKRFFTRTKKKKSSKPTLRESGPSTQNLLESEETVTEPMLSSHDDLKPVQEDVEDDRLLSLSATRSVPEYRTVQRPPYHPDTVVTQPADLHKSSELC